MHPTRPALPARTVLPAPADARAGALPAVPVAEIVTFSLVAGCEVAAFLDAARATAAAVAARPGFRRRVLSRDAAGTWTDHVEWADLASADAAAQALAALPAFARFVACIDPAGMTLRHARIHWTMGD